jgi:anti-sigma factor RsiW
MSTSDHAIRADERAMKLMAYADGELYAEGREEELAEVEKWLAEDANATRFANDVAKLGELVKAGQPKRDFDIADAVMARLDEKVEEKPAAKVVPLERAREKKRNTVGWVVTGLALAASVFFVTRSKHDDEAPLARTTSPLVQPQQAAAVVTGSVDVESAGNSVSVIYVPDEKNVGSTATVVWVDESGGK